MNKNVLVSIDWKEKEKVYVRYQEASALARMEEANENRQHIWNNGILYWTSDKNYSDSKETGK